ncbi:hypothetical protein [Altericista sp. CCNU0014]|uniref:hypothetical protein n=1 Tax=Altericista sp. CCNU0014 TaxID=3082949 RepID=UPI0038516464
MTKSNASRSVSSDDSNPALNSSPELPSEGVEEMPSMTMSRQQPISPPSEPMQFRAIGLVQGKYRPSEDRFNRGVLEVEGGLQIDAVLLGQVMSLVKKYIDLDRLYFWVVYPRTREKEQTLHLQVVGVWSADGFSPITGEEQAAPASANTELAQPIEDGYFSVRGQIVYQSNEKELLYVKIQQTARKTKSRDERNKAFKLKIIGTLPQKAVGYFWDLNVKRQGNDLVLQNGTSIALMPVQKNQRPQKRAAGKPFTKMPYSAKPNLANRSNAAANPNRESRPVPKPIKRQRDASD